MLALKEVLLEKFVSELSPNANLGAYMPPAIGRLGERLTAMLAAERLDAQVYMHVVKGTWQAPESHLTLLAGQDLIRPACARIFDIATI